MYVLSFLFRTVLAYGIFVELSVLESVGAAPVEPNLLNF